MRQRTACMWHVASDGDREADFVKLCLPCSIGLGVSKLASILETGDADISFPFVFWQSDLRFEWKMTRDLGRVVLE